jgi:hypothetical protein
MDPKRFAPVLSLALGLVATVVLLWLCGNAGAAVAASQENGPLAATSARFVATTGSDAGDCSTPASPCRTVQYAVDRAAGGDVVLVASGLYTGVNSYGGLRQALYLSKTLTVRGVPTTTDWTTLNAAAMPTVLDAENDGRVIYVTGDISPTIAGLKITGGWPDGLGGGSPSAADAGGGIYVHNASATISNCHVVTNLAEVGGGLYLNQANADVISNVVAANLGGARGGGAYLYQSDATLADNTLIENYAGSGGGLYVEQGGASLEANTVRLNTAADWGGGIALENDATALTGNAILSNTVEDKTGLNGGGLSLEDSAADLAENTIAANSAPTWGGGLFLSGGHPTLRDNLIRDNDAGGTGGGLYISSDATLTSNRIFGNSATEGGGLSIVERGPVLSGNTIAGNIALTGGGFSLVMDTSTLDGNYILSNTAGLAGGGLFIADRSDARLLNSIIASNTAEMSGSGLYILDAAPQLLHSTIARNRGGDGSGVVVTQEFLSSRVTMTNTILVSHTLGISVTEGNTVSLQATLWGAGSWANDADWDGGGTILVGARNLWENPAFVAPEAGDYHLRADSAAIDAGLEAGVETDIDGDSRPDRCFPDLGADEHVTGLDCIRIYLPFVLRNG